jgi:hypothetical protein
MLPIINLTSNKSFIIKNFEEDKVATLNAHRGLRYLGVLNDCYTFRGNFYLLNPHGDLIESFEILIIIGKSYPNTFPIVILLDDKIEKSDDYHISKEGIICFEHTYVTNALAQSSLRLYDFVNYFLPKYFSWVLVKREGDVHGLQEWGHKEDGTKQFYENLIGTKDRNTICLFLENYCSATKINRNDKCYCGNDKKIKHCHLKAAQFLNATSKQTIFKDIDLFQ